jgi:hypothetical protein
MSRIETWVTKITHVNEHVDQVLHSNDPQLGGTFAKRPSVAPLPVQDRLFFVGIQWSSVPIIRWHVNPCLKARFPAQSADSQGHYGPDQSVGKIIRGQQK